MIIFAAVYVLMNIHTPLSLYRGVVTAFKLRHITSTVTCQLGQTKLICCCSDSPVVCLSNRKKKRRGSKVEFNAHAQLCIPCDLENGSDFWARHSPSVRVQSGCRTLLTKIRFTPLSVTFAELFLHLSEEDDCVGERCVYKVTIADRPGNGGGTKVDLTAPVSLCEEFNAKYVTFFLSSDESATAAPALNHCPNAFQVLMHAMSLIVLNDEKFHN